MDLSKYQIPKKSKEANHASEFAMYVDLTAKLINRPYMQTFKLVDTWALHKIKRRYDEAIAKENPQKYWWGMRRKDLKANK
jgi:hypothetical protein